MRKSLGFLNRIKERMFNFLIFLVKLKLQASINIHANRELAARMAKKEGTGQGCLY